MRQVIAERAACPDFAKVPGGTTGLLCRDLRCKDTPVYKVDTGLLAELRAHEQQAAQELSQWQTRSVVEEPKVIDVTPASMTLAMVMTAAELEELERRMLELQQAQGATTSVPWLSCSAGLMTVTLRSGRQVQLADAGNIRVSKLSYAYAPTGQEHK